MRQYFYPTPGILPKDVNVIYAGQEGEAQENADAWAREYTEKHKGKTPITLGAR